MKRENTDQMLRQLARFVRQRRRQILKECSSKTVRKAVSEINKSPLRAKSYSGLEASSDLEEPISVSANSPSDTCMSTCSDEYVVLVPAAEFVEVFRDLEQVRKDAFAVWWATRNAHTETTAAA